MPAIIIVYIWKNLGFATVIFLAGLQAIPQDLYEAAKVDGAGACWRFRSVTLPMLSPIIFFLGDLDPQLVPVVRHHPGDDPGRPGRCDQHPIYYIYQQGFVAFNAGGRRRPRWCSS